MTMTVVAASIGLIAAGPSGAAVGALAPWVAVRLRRSAPPPETRLILLLLLVEVRSGLSILAALQAASAALAHRPDLRRVSRIATVSGLTSAIAVAGPQLRPLVTQLARAQASGASLVGVLRSMLERDLATERAERIARARSLPVRLMIPVTLLMLPGLVLLLYAPSLFGLFSELTGVWR
ncbi:MAG: type II secretion system F family protein [Actinobacteria bacterium]|nr:type II secretion system F family protein [Actinomycetota bacterium]